MELLRRLPQHLNRTAVIYAGKSFSYESLLNNSEAISEELSKSLPQPSSANPPRVGLYAAPGPEYVAGTWAIWRSGGICVPLATSYPPKELSYFFKDAGLSAVLTPPADAAKLQRVAYEAGTVLQLMQPPESTSAPFASQAAKAAAQEHGDRDTSKSGSESSSAGHLTDWGRGALIIYTSGTTGAPKGVLHTSRSIQAQIESLVSAWEWSRDDQILHALPLHHIHGVINAMYCAHHVGAAVDFLPKFSPSRAWQKIADGDVTVLMAVPTMYNYLLSHYEAAMESEEQRAAAQRGAAALRLAVCGSAACPLPILSRWRQLTGHTLLERYGMTETGMILSNPYRGERWPGTVGLPLPGVQVKVADDGEVRVKGPNLFKEYWGRPRETAEAYDEDGWFRTGDTGGLVLPTPHDGGTPGAPPAATQDGYSSDLHGANAEPSSDGAGGAPARGDEHGSMAQATRADAYYAIFGRTSVDIIKSGGYKISALAIENVLLEHPGVMEAAVVGVPDEAVGEVIWALLAAKPEGPEPDANELRAFCAERLAPYQTPRVYRFVDALPRNAMGKLNKKELIKELMA